jgi:Cu+-exporting ATPase
MKRVSFLVGSCRSLLIFLSSHAAFLPYIPPKLVEHSSVMASLPHSIPVLQQPDQVHTDKIAQPAMAVTPLSVVTTTFLISNMHCPSCVAHIKDVLFSLQPSPIAVSPSLLSSWVTVQHDGLLSVKDIADALSASGFDVCDVAADHGGAFTSTPSLGASGPSQFCLAGDIGYLDRFIDKFQPAEARFRSPSTHLSQHLQNCESCRQEAVRKQKTPTVKSPISDSTKLVGTPQPITTESAIPVGTMSSSSIDEKTGFPLVAVDSKGSDIWRASIAVGGMTCASCANTITKELVKKDWVRKVVVNLISNSATVDFIGEEHKNIICGNIEDIGFEATLDNVVNLEAAEKGSHERSIHRTVDILIQGMYCDNCPGRVIDAIETFTGRVKVEKPPTVRDPVMTILYTPDLPSFTIRNIVAAIAEIDPAFKPTIYHPPTLEERSRKIHTREQLRILLRVALTLALAVPTLVIGIIYMSLIPSNNPGRQYLMTPLRSGISRAQWALFIMATPVYFVCADVFHVRALKEIRSMWRPGSKHPILQRFYRFGSMNMLMSVGTSIAYWSSVAQLIAAGVHSNEMVDNGSFYFDSVIFLTLFLLVGRLIESYSKSKTGDAVAMLGKLRPTEALLVTFDIDFAASDETLNNGNGNGNRGETIQLVNVDLLEFGDVVKVLHGGSPPCDGEVVRGETKFDESSLTGESRLVKKVIGDEVFSGTVNKDAPVSIKITGVAGSTMLDQIVKAIREGQTKRAPMERIADTLTSYFVPFVTLVAIATWLIWLGLGLSGVLPDDYLGSETEGWVVWSLQFAIAVFVVACPCGLALAAPTAIFVGGGLAAKHGILVKGGGEAFEKASRLDCIVFDKTGTLTVGGEPIVTDSKRFVVEVEAAEDEIEAERRILGMINAIEGNSSHTIAKAIVSFCRERQLDVGISVDDLEEVAGKGMKGTFHINAKNDRTEMLIGNELLMLDNQIDISHAQNRINGWKSKGRSVALVAMRSFSEKNKEDNWCFPTTSWQLVAAFAISDPVRPEATGIIKALQKRGKDVWMLSGDNQITANAIGAQVGIPASNIIAGVLPGQKAEKIQYLQRSLKQRGPNGAEHSQNRAVVAMVGDGINDSPALTTADIGIAIGSGSDIAISSAEFVLVSSNLNSLLTLLDLSKFVFRRIKFNFGWALVYNLTALPVAAGALYPFKGGSGTHIRLDPVWASLAMAMSSISVVMSSLALRSKLPVVGFKAQKNVLETVGK